MHNSDCLIKVSNVSVFYTNGLQAIDQVSFDLKKGTICALIGVNGSGKSTLFKSLMGLIKPQQGQIELCNGPIKLALKSNKISYVPQNEDIDWNFPVSVGDVVMMGRYGHMNFLRIAKQLDHKKVDAALERVGILALKKRQISELSGGQKKRVFLARALAQESQIMLLDEPFTGVDLNTENKIIDLLKQLRNEGLLILISTHNLGSVPEFCDECILINKKIIAQGSIASTYTQKNLEKAFGGVLRHLQLSGKNLHDDPDPRKITIITDDERPAVFYGSTDEEAALSTEKNKRAIDHQENK